MAERTTDQVLTRSSVADAADITASRLETGRIRNSESCLSSYLAAFLPRIGEKHGPMKSGHLVSSVPPVAIPVGAEIDFNFYFNW